MPYLTPTERIRIEIKRRETRLKKEHVRLSVLIMLDEGLNHELIALSHGIDADTISNWKRKYESVSRNLDQYLTDNYVPFQGYLTEEQLTAVDAHLQEYLYLTSHQVGDYLFDAFGLEYSDAGVTAILHRLNFVYKKVKPVPGKADELAQQTFVEQLQELLETPNTAVYFTDATHPTHNTQPHYGWIKKGEEKQIATNSGRNHLNIQGAIHVGSRSIKTIINTVDKVNSESTIELYSQLLKKHTNGQIVVVCDNAGYHKSKLLSEWLVAHPRIYQKPLPISSPNLNIIERLWKWMKKKVTATVYYPTFAEYKKAVLDLVARLPDYKTELKSLLTLNFQIIKSPLLA